MEYKISLGDKNQMKTKSLNLKKTTIAHLNEKEMNTAKGGTITTITNEMSRCQMCLPGPETDGN